MGLRDFYFFANVGCIVVLALSLYFAVLSHMPVFDMRKTGQRKTFGLFFFYLAAIVKIVLIFVWYFLLQEIVLELSIERCIMEIFRNISPFSWVVCALKILSVPAILFHFSLRHLDKDFKIEPFRDYRVSALFVTVPIIMLESVTDIMFIQKLKVYIYDVKDRIFNLHSVNEVLPVLGLPFFWTVVFFLVTVLLSALLLFVLKYSSEDVCRISIKKLAYMKIAIGVTAILYLLSMLLSFNNELCPLFLDLSNQHCLFCMLQCSFDLPALLYVGILVFGWSVVFTFIPHTTDDKLRMLEVRFESIFVDKFQDIAKWIFVISFLQIFIMGIHIVLYVMRQ
jgi:hypothetical protein